MEALHNALGVDVRAKDLEVVVVSKDQPKFTWVLRLSIYYLHHNVWLAIAFVCEQIYLVL